MKPPPEARLPDDLKPLTWLHAIPVRADSFRSDVDHLADFLREFLDGPAVAPVARTAPVVPTGSIQVEVGATSAGDT